MDENENENESEKENENENVTKPQKTRRKNMTKAKKTRKKTRKKRVNKETNTITNTITNMNSDTDEIPESNFECDNTNMNTNTNTNNLYPSQRLELRIIKNILMPTKDLYSKPSEAIAGSLFYIFYSNNYQKYIINVQENTMLKEIKYITAALLFQKNSDKQNIDEFTNWQITNQFTNNVNMNISAGCPYHKTDAIVYCTINILRIENQNGELIFNKQFQANIRKQITPILNFSLIYNNQSLGVHTFPMVTKQIGMWHVVLFVSNDRIKVHLYLDQLPTQFKKLTLKVKLTSEYTESQIDIFELEYSHVFIELEFKSKVFPHTINIEIIKYTGHNDREHLFTTRDEKAVTKKLRHKSSNRTVKTKKSKKKKQRKMLMRDCNIDDDNDYLLDLEYPSDADQSECIFLDCKASAENIVCTKHVGFTYCANNQLKDDNNKKCWNAARMSIKYARARAWDKIFCQKCFLENGGIITNIKNIDYRKYYPMESLIVYGSNTKADTVKNVLLHEFKASTNLFLIEIKNQNKIALLRSILAKIPMIHTCAIIMHSANDKYNDLYYVFGSNPTDRILQSELHSLVATASHGHTYFNAHPFVIMSFTCKDLSSDDDSFYSSIQSHHIVIKTISHTVNLSNVAKLLVKHHETIFNKMAQNLQKIFKILYIFHKQQIHLTVVPYMVNSGQVCNVNLFKKCNEHNCYRKCQKTFDWITSKFTEWIYESKNCNRLLTCRRWSGYLMAQMPNLIPQKELNELCALILKELLKKWECKEEYMPFCKLTEMFQNIILVRKFTYQKCPKDVSAKLMCLMEPFWKECIVAKLLYECNSKASYSCLLSVKFNLNVDVNYKEYYSDYCKKMFENKDYEKADYGMDQTNWTWPSTHTNWTQMGNKYKRLKLN